ncbi:hypothetical protein F511_19848 [Dorcoceras hygrometricum]|uniref:Uncharacterized protein n=1 Tax=Dorcoceras hygrometricum TaxID=472368 RepID=A0A2Z7AQV6_9LAMI|nr:hypothetical protein F511_19848 [Dorcoceras hygrometricum]
MRESQIQYLCDPQWFRDTASRGPTTIVAPESQFRTCPLDHDSIGYPCMSASGESSTTMHRLRHASGSHPIPPPNDPKSVPRVFERVALRGKRNDVFLDYPVGVSRCERQLGEVMCWSMLLCGPVRLRIRDPTFLIIFRIVSRNPTVHSNPISFDFHRFTPPFGARLVALSSSSLGLLIDTSLET